MPRLLGQNSVFFIFPKSEIAESWEDARIRVPRISCVRIISCSVARESQWKEFEYSQPKPGVGVSHVIAAVSQRHSSRTNIICCWRTVWIGLYLIPDTVEIGTCCVVEFKVVAGVGHPEWSYWDVSLKHVGDGEGADGQISLDDVVCFDTVFHEEVVSTHSIANVVLYSQIVHSVDSYHSGEGVMNCISPRKRIWDISQHMEMDAVTTQDLRLSAMSKLRVSNVSGETAVDISRQHQMRTISACNRCLVSHHFNVSGQKSNLSPHIDGVSSIGLLCSVMLINEGGIHCDCCSWNWNDCSLLSLCVFKAWGGDNDAFSSHPINRVRKCKSGGSNTNCGGEGGPSAIARDSIHSKFAVHTSNAFVTKHGLLRTIVISSHHEC